MGRRQKRASFYKNKQIQIERHAHKSILDEHIISIEELVARLDSDIDKGLSEDQVFDNLRRDGKNVITPQPKTPQIVSFMRNLFGGFGILLLTGAALCFIAYFIHYFKNNDHSKQSLWLGVSLIIIDVFSAFFSFYQEEKCKTIINSFKKIAPAKASIIRDNVIKVVKVENIVVGDIVLLKAGDKVPADMRIIEANKLQVDNSSLTGESDPQTRSPDFTNVDPLRTQNLVFLSTLVVEGNGIGIVIKTGDRTVMGQIAYLVSEVEYYETTLNREINEFIRSISVAALIIGFLFFWVSFLYGYYWLDSVIFLISILVAKVPEGLLATITLALTLIAKRISKKNCLVKNLEAVETLGATTVICSDKTGTLTQNKMVASHLWIDNQIETVDSFETRFVLSNNPNIFDSNELLRCCALTTNASFDLNDLHLPIKMRNCKGNPSEIAIFKFLESLSCNVTKYRSDNPKLFEIPFSSANKYQLAVHKTTLLDGNEDLLVVMKGAPERILQNCSEILVNCRVNPMNTYWKRKIDECCRTLGNKGERILGFCELRLDRSIYNDEFPFDIKITDDGLEHPNFPLKNMRFLGLMSLMDPPRPGVKNAVQKCISAGIRVIMITGDHPATAKSIAKSVGIITHDTIDEIAEKEGVYQAYWDKDSIKAAVIDGDYLKTLSNDQLDELLRKYPEIVFARTTPYQKVNIVESCQRLGGIVAVTGDGVNDSPALKTADIGIAMGIAGSDVSKEAADILLLDDNFATIEIAIEEGRLIFDNLKKSITYILASKMPELLPFITYVCYMIPLPLGAITILCIDLGTDLLPAISLAYEKPEGDIMKRKPRNSQFERLVNMNLISLSYGQYGMMAASAGFFTYLVIMTQNGFFPSRLMGISRSWDTNSVNDLEDSYGQEWTFEQRKALEYTCHSGFFISVVIVQIATLIVSKTRKSSLFYQGMNNYALNISLFIELCLAIFLCYTPIVRNTLQMYPLRLEWWIPSIFFSLLLFVYDEIRKLLIRKFPGGWIERETYS